VTLPPVRAGDTLLVDAAWEMRTTAQSSDVARSQIVYADQAGAVVVLADRWQDVSTDGKNNGDAPWLMTRAATFPQIFCNVTTSMTVPADAATPAVSLRGVLFAQNGQPQVGTSITLFSPASLRVTVIR
jgi:hypothetical protein